MNDTERKKFKSQYDEEDWSQLIRNPEFQKAWDEGDRDKADIMAARILKGEARTIKEAREKNFLYRAKKEYR